MQSPNRDRADRFDGGNRYALDVPGDRMFVTDFAGSIYSARLDWIGKTNVPAGSGNFDRHRICGSVSIGQLAIYFEMHVHKEPPFCPKNGVINR